MTSSNYHAITRKLRSHMWSGAWQTAHFPVDYDIHLAAICHLVHKTLHPLADLGQYHQLATVPLLHYPTGDVTSMFVQDSAKLLSTVDIGILPAVC